MAESVSGHDKTTLPNNMKKYVTLIVALSQFAWAGSTYAASPISIGPDTLPVFTAGQAFAFSLAATGAVPPYGWSPNMLPPGFNLNTNLGIVYGTPPQAGNFVLFVRATDASGTNSQRGWNVHVNTSSGSGSGGGTPGSGGGTVTPSPAQYTVTVINGTLAGGTTNGSFAPGATVSILAGTPPSGQWFSLWNATTPVANLQSNLTTFAMPAANVTAMAKFYTPPNLVQPVAAHPRLWLTTNDLPRLRGWANANNPVFAQNLNSQLSVALAAYKKCFPNGQQPASPYPDLGDDYGYSGNLITSDLVSEYHELTLAFYALVDNNASNRVRYAQMARQMLMYEMNEAAKGHTNGAPFRDPYFAIYNRSHGVGEMWALIVDWLQGVTDASDRPVAILSAQDKLTIRNVFVMWANDCLNAYTTGGDHPAPIGVMNSPALLPNGNAMRIAANNYYSSHARLITMMPLALDAADDQAINPAAPGGVLGNTLRSYLLDATGAWLYQQFALYGDAATVRSLYGLPTNSVVGLSSGGLPVEGTLYGHSYAYVLGQLLALQTAGFNDPTLSGPQIALIGAPVWDRFAQGYISDLVNTPKLDPTQTYLGQIYQFAGYGDMLRLYVTPDLTESFSLLTLLEQRQGNYSHQNAARWFALNAPNGGAAGFPHRSWSSSEVILYFMLFDPALPAPVDPRPAYATSFFDAPQARLISRSGWSAKDTLFTYRAAPESINHVNGDAGQFELWRNGEWLIEELSCYDNYGNGESTIWHNTLALKNWCPAGTPYLQPFEQAYFPNGSTWNNAANAGDPVTISSLANGYDYLQTDLTPLYNRPSLFKPTNALVDILHASRSIFHLNKDYVVVYDRATSLHPGLFKRFNLNFTATPAIDQANKVVTETTPGGQKLFVQSLLPANASISWVTPGNSISTYAESQQTIGRIVVEDTGNPADIRFLHVVQGADATTPMDQATVVQSSSGSAFEGALLGDTVILFARTLGTAFLGTSYSVPPTTGTHLVSGLTPGASYTVTTRHDANGNLQVLITPGGPMTADSGGVLAFTLNIGG